MDIDAIDADEDILKRVAKGGSQECSSWQTLLPDLVSLIEKIAHTQFPIPRIPPPKPPARAPSPRFLAPLPSSDPTEPPHSPTSASSSQETNKENANPSAATAPSDSSSRTLSASNPALPPIQPPVERGTLPPPINAVLENITSILTVNFARYPPHTIQRLAEVVLSPTQHYRSLTAYLHGLDRLVHVTAGANTYPLPPAIPDMSALSMPANGAGAGGQGQLTPNSAASNNGGIDENLGGALLTPIPWLTRRTNGEDDGTGSESGGSSSPLSAQNQSQGADQEEGHNTQAPLHQHRPSHGQQPGRQLEGRVRTESTETIEGPNGVGSIETVSVSVNGIPSVGASTIGAVLVSRGITQGELLRQEQRAGVVPISQLARHGHAGGGGIQGIDDTPAAAGADTSSPPGDEDAPMPDEHEIPHASGPEEIGPADTGPQQETTSTYTVGSGLEMHGIDVERAVGRRSEAHPPSSSAGPSGADQLDGTAESTPQVSQSPKREAEEQMEPGVSKRPREDHSAQEEGEGRLEDGKDAEGDVVVDGDDDTTGSAAGLGDEGKAAVGDGRIGGAGEGVGPGSGGEEEREREGEGGLPEGKV